jgi:hypothetical protein
LTPSTCPPQSHSAIEHHAMSLVMDMEEPQDDAAWIALEAKAEAHEE